MFLVECEFANLTLTLKLCKKISRDSQLSSQIKTKTRVCSQCIVKNKLYSSEDTETCQAETRTR